MRTGTGSAKIVGNDFEHQRLVLMTRRAKYTMYFVTLPARPYLKQPDYTVCGQVTKLSQL